MTNIVVDAMGDQCPIPVVKATKALNEMSQPGTVEVRVDNEIAVQNLSRLANSRGLACRSEKLGDQQYRVCMTVEQPAAAPVVAPAPVCQGDSRGDYVVAVSSAGMGQGADELGATLMKGFLYALSQLETLPKAILFYNGGAQLTVTGSASIEDLKSMEAQGVEILTCGTCLNYYGLTDQLAVGSVTNMYAIVEKLAAAAKVIRP